MYSSILDFTLNIGKHYFLSLKPINPCLCNLLHLWVASIWQALKYSFEFLSSISHDLGLGLLMSIVNSHSGYSDFGCNGGLIQESVLYGNCVQEILKLGIFKSILVV